MRPRPEYRAGRKRRSSSARVLSRSEPRALDDRVRSPLRRTMDDPEGPGSRASPVGLVEKYFGQQASWWMRARRTRRFRGRERTCMRRGPRRRSKRGPRSARHHPRGFAQTVRPARVVAPDARPMQRPARGRDRSPSKQPDYVGTVPSISSTIAAVRFAAPGAPSRRLARSSSSIWRSRASPWKSGASAAAIRSRVAAC